MTIMKREEQISDIVGIISTLKIILGKLQIAKPDISEESELDTELEIIKNRYNYMKTLDVFGFNYIHGVVEETGKSIDSVIDEQMDYYRYGDNVVYELLKPLPFADAGSIFRVSTIIDDKKQFDVFVTGGFQRMNKYENGILCSILQQQQWIKRINSYERYITRFV